MKKYILTERQHNLIKRRLITETVSEFSVGCDSNSVNTIQDVRQCILSSVSDFKSGKNKQMVGAALSNIDKVEEEETKENIVKLYKHLYNHNNKNVIRPITVISNFVSVINKLFQFLPGNDFKQSEVLLNKLIEHMSWSEDLQLGPKKISGVLRALSCYMFGFRGKKKKGCTKVLKGDEGSFIKELQGLRHAEYTTYENSFEPYGFVVSRSYPKITTIPRKDLLSFDSLRTEKSEDELNIIVETTFNHIMTNIDDYIVANPNENTQKFDLIYGKDGFPSTIDFNNGRAVETLIEEKDKIEVKKIKYRKSSYLSEFLAMGKNSEISLEFGTDPHLLRNYNYVITSVYNKIKENETKFINFIIGNMKGMFFDDYIYTPKSNINFELRDVGARGDREKRLSIWYEIIDENKVVQLNKDENNNVWFSSVG